MAGRGAPTPSDQPPVLSAAPAVNVSVHVHLSGNQIPTDVDREICAVCLDMAGRLGAVTELNGL